MAKLAVKPDTTSVTVYLFIQNSSVTTGAGLTGLVFNSASLVAYYVRPLGSATAITLATQTVTGAFSSGGFVEVDATNMPGIYRLDLPDAVCATGVRSAAVMLKGATNMAPVTLEIDLNAQVNVEQFGGTNGTFAAGRPEVNTSHAAGTAWGSGAITAASIAADAITAAKIANAAIDAATFAAGAIDAAAIAADAITAAKIADNAIDRATFAADTGLQTIRSNTAQAGAAGTITLDAAASAVNDFYNDCWVFLTGGTGVGQARLISAYVGATKVASVIPNWATTPDATSTFAVLPQGRVDVGQVADTAQTARDLGAQLDAAVSSRLASASITLTGGAVTVGTNNDKTGYAVGAGGIAATAFAAGAIDAAAIAADAIGASEIAANAIGSSEIADGALTDAKFDSAGKLRSHFTGVLKLVVGVGSTTTAVVFSTVDGAAPSATNDFYKGRVIVFTSGTLAGQATDITAYTGATTTATVTALTSAPANTDTAVIV